MTPGWENLRLALAASLHPAPRWRPRLVPLALGGALWVLIILGVWGFVR